MDNTYKIRREPPSKCCACGIAIVAESSFVHGRLGFDVKYDPWPCSRASLVCSRKLISSTQGGIAIEVAQYTKCAVPCVCLQANT